MKHRKLILTLAVVVCICVSAFGVTMGVRDSGGTGAIGQEVAITIGNPVYAAGTPDYICDGAADDVQFQQAMNALPATGGRLVVLTGTYVFTATVTRAIDNITIEGTGRGTYITYNGANPVFTAGGNNWELRSLRTDAGSINMGATTGWMWTNVTINATYYAYRSPYGQSVFNDVTVASLIDSGLTSGRVPTAGVGGLLGDSANLTFDGTSLQVSSANVTRAATLTVAASDSSSASKAQADYVCDGTGDQVEIMAAISALPATGGTVLLLEGNYSVSAPIMITKDFLCLEGQGWSTVVAQANGINDNVIEFSGDSDFPRIRDFKIYGNRGNNTAGHGIYIPGTAFVPDLLIENMLINHCDNDGVNHRAVDWHFDFINNTVEFCANALYLTKKAGAGGSDAHVNILGNQLRLSSVGMSIPSSVTTFRGLVMMDNTLVGNTGYGALLYDLEGALIIGNTVHDNCSSYHNTRDGFRIFNSTYCIVANNMFNDGLEGGDQQYGFREASGCDYNLVVDNDCRGNQTGGMIISGVNTVASGNMGYLGINETRTFSQVVNYDDASPVVVANVEDGYAVTDVWVEVTVIFNDTGPQTLDVGDGGNNSGFMANANINLGVVGYYGYEADDRGAYLWDNVNSHERDYVYTGNDTVDCFIGAGNADGTQGQAIIYVKVTRIGG